MGGAEALLALSVDATRRDFIVSRDRRPACSTRRCARTSLMEIAFLFGFADQFAFTRALMDLAIADGIPPHVM